MRLFHWTMRYGAMILFLFAIWEVVAGVVEVWNRWETIGATSGAWTPTTASLAVRLAMAVHYFSYAIPPFVGALVIYRIDRWLNAQPRTEAAE